MAAQYDENIEAQVSLYRASIDALTVTTAIKLHLIGTLELWKLKSYALLNAAGRGVDSYSLGGKSFGMTDYAKIKSERDEAFDEIQMYVGEVGTGSGTTLVDFGGVMYG